LQDPIALKAFDDGPEFFVVRRAPALQPIEEVHVRRIEQTLEGGELARR
jgi:hypothetical protein